MSNTYHNPEKSQEKKEKNPLDPQTVFTIKHSELIGKTQCGHHSWVKLSDNEVKCAKCPTALVVAEDYLKELIKNNANY